MGEFTRSSSPLVLLVSYTGAYAPPFLGEFVLSPNTDRNHSCTSGSILEPEAPPEAKETVSVSLVSSGFPGFVLLDLVYLAVLIFPPDTQYPGQSPADLLGRQSSAMLTSAGMPRVGSGARRAGRCSKVP